jgi:hypothetical protein
VREREFRTLEKVEQLIRGEEKGPRTCREKPIEGGETKRRRRRGRTRRRREGILSNFPQTYLDSKYGSCNFLPPVLETLELKMKKKTLRK